jgi:hypothetical protein
MDFMCSKFIKECLRIMSAGGGKRKQDWRKGEDEQKAKPTALSDSQGHSGVTMAYQI